MFMCKACHEKDEYCRWGFESHSRSQGPCEVCRKVAVCVDCKAYKYVERENGKAKRT
jgi:hypothetical protein